MPAWLITLVGIADTDEWRAGLTLDIWYPLFSKPNPRTHSRCTHSSRTHSSRTLNSLVGTRTMPRPLPPPPSWTTLDKDAKVNLEHLIRIQATPFSR